MSARNYTFLSPSLGVAFALAACGGPQKTAPAAEPQAGSATTATTMQAGATYNAVPLIPRRVLFGNPSKVSPKLSPDGKRLAYLAPNEGVLNIWVQTIGQDDARALTRDRHRGIHRYFWAPDSTQLLYPQDQNGDENWHVWAIGLAGGEAKDLTPIKGVQATIIAVENAVPDRILIGLNDRSPQLHDVYSLNLRTAERTLVQQNNVTALAWVTDHELRVRGALALRSDGGAAILHRTGGSGKLEPILEWGAEDMMTTGPVGFGPDNRILYWYASVGSNTTQLRAFDTRSKKETVLASDETADITDMMIHPTKHTVEAVAFQRARIEWKVLDGALEEDFAVLAKVDDGDFQVTSRDVNNTTWLVAYDHDDGPVVYYAYDRAKQEATRMFSQRPELETVQLGRMKPVSWTARDGLTIHGYLTVPPAVDAKSLPAVVVPHGGPWYRDAWGFDSIAQWLANRGYAVLQPNFRGSTGYGKKFLNAANKEWGGKMQDDITDGTQWLVDQGVADPKRIAIMGGSYGGYATLMGLVREPTRYACGVDIVGVANLFTWMETIPPYWVPLRHVLHQRVGHPEQDKALLTERSPIFQVGKIQAPLLIGQGANDPRVPKAESIQIRDALLAAGKTVDYLEFPDEGHGFAKPENRLKFFAHAEKFLAQHIGGRAEN